MVIIIYEVKKEEQKKTVDLSDLLKFMVRTQIIIFQRFHLNNLLLLLFFFCSFSS